MAGWSYRQGVGGQGLASHWGQLHWVDGGGSAQVPGRLLAEHCNTTSAGAQSREDASCQKEDMLLITFIEQCKNLQKSQRHHQVKATEQVAATAMTP